MAKKKKELTFEELLQQTEEAVGKLESGELSLEESMELYELGVNNLKKCSLSINEAQKKVQQLIEKSSGELGLEDFDSEEE
ncbi:MAG: exodeoxyribonuclease VII small subunit [Planctomycetota bacterium]|jgi:exodeoxyribonuclease VII small subunit